MKRLSRRKRISNIGVAMRKMDDWEKQIKKRIAALKKKDPKVYGVRLEKDFDPGVVMVTLLKGAKTAYTDYPEALDAEIENLELFVSNRGGAIWMDLDDDYVVKAFTTEELYIDKDEDGKWYIYKDHKLVRTNTPKVVNGPYNSEQQAREAARKFAQNKEIQLSESEMKKATSAIDNATLKRVFKEGNVLQAEDLAEMYAGGNDKDVDMWLVDNQISFDAVYDTVTFAELKVFEGDPEALFSNYPVADVEGDKIVLHSVYGGPENKVICGSVKVSRY